MSYHKTFLRWMMLVVSLMFHHSAGAEPHQDQNRILNIYHVDQDACFEVSPHTNHEAKEAANSACEDAFLALDRLGSNSCNGWRRPKCRQLQLPNYQYFECSCKISSITYFDIKSDTVSTFRDCAWRVYAEAIFFGQGGAPSARYQSTRQRIYDQAVQKARLRHTSSSSGAGTSYSTQIATAPGFTVSSDSAQASTSTNNGNFECQICGRLYGSSHGMRDHLQSHRRNLRCTDCGIPFSTVGNLNRHIKKRHPGMKTVAAKHAAIKYAYECEICGKGFHRETSLKAHIVVHTEDVRCHHCNQDFSTKSNLKQHNKFLHPEIFAADEAEEKKRIMARPHVCSTCETRFTTWKQLREHMPVHKGETYCNLCDRTFARKSILKSHNRSQHSSS